MVRRKVLHLAVILSMLLTMVGVVLPAAVGAAGLQISPTSILFAPQQVGTQSPDGVHIVTITNLDNVLPYTINNITLLSGANFAVTGNGCNGAVLQAGIGDNCTFAVVFTPGTISLGQLQDQVQINYTTGGPAVNSFVSVSGTSTTPSIKIETPGSATPLTLDFVEQQVSSTPFGNSQSAPKEVKFTNTGQGPVLFITK